MSMKRPLLSLEYDGMQCQPSFTYQDWMQNFRMTFLFVCQELKSMKYGKLVSLPFVWCLGLPHNQRCVYVSVYVHCWPSSKVYPYVMRLKRNWGFHSALGSNWRYTYTTTRVPRQPAPLRFSFSSFGCHWLSLIKTSSSCRILFTFNYI